MVNITTHRSEIFKIVQTQWTYYIFNSILYRCVSPVRLCADPQEFYSLRPLSFFTAIATIRSLFPSTAQTRNKSDIYFRNHYNIRLIIWTNHIRARLTRDNKNIYYINIDFTTNTSCSSYLYKYGDTNLFPGTCLMTSVEHSYLTTLPPFS